jgi:hypothetical protein
MWRLRVGDIFCTPLPLGYWGAARVYNVCEEKGGNKFGLVYCTQYCERRRPEISDQRLLQVARAVHQVDGSNHVIVGAVYGMPKAPFEFVGNIPAEASEQAMVVRRLGSGWDQAYAGVAEYLYGTDRAEFHRFWSACFDVDQSPEVVRSSWSPRGRKGRSLTEDGFWMLMEAAKPVNGVAKLVQLLSGMEIPSIVEFGEWLAYKMYCLDGEKYASNAGPAGSSDDGFLYARCYVVACGKKVYDDIRKNPRKFPRDADCEDLLEAVPRAYKMKTGRELDLQFAYDYETGSNDRGW